MSRLYPDHGGQEAVIVACCANAEVPNDSRRETDPHLRRVPMGAEAAEAEQTGNCLRPLSPVDLERRLRYRRD